MKFIFIMNHTEFKKNVLNWASYKWIYKKKCCFNLLKVYFMFWKSRRVMMYMYSYITYNATLALSVVNVTEPTVFKCLRYYYIIVAVRRIKWLPFWTWAFANRSRHYTRGVCNDHKRSFVAPYKRVPTFVISKDTGIAKEHIWTKL